MTTLLTDVRVDTLGLVDKGANREEFFLLKSDDQPAKSLLDKVVNAVKQAFGGEPGVTKEVTMSEPVKEPEVTKTEATPTTEPTVENEVAKTEEVVKTEPVAEDKFAALEKSLNDQKAELNELRKQLVTTAKRAESAEETVIEKAYVEKAAKLDGLPVKTDDLAKHLYALKKAGVSDETMTFFDGLFTAVNNIAKDSKILDEFGTTQIPEIKSLTEKASALAKDGKSFRDALLELPFEIQQAYLDEQYNKNTK